MLITTLFNLFCPFVSGGSVKSSLVYMSLISILLIVCVGTLMSAMNTKAGGVNFCKSLFPLSGIAVLMMVGGFLLLAGLNLMSLICYSFPVTTTLSFNLSVALCLWLSSVLFIFLKVFTSGVILPANSPWYLAPFLSVVELISILVRPITLCFRLLANMSAGHVLLTLICKMGFGLWVLGVLFGVLELMVAFVQAFVFMMLTTVYLEEAFSH